MLLPRIRGGSLVMLRDGRRATGRVADRPSGGALEAPVGPEVRGGLAVVAAEGLGELGGLAIPDAVGHVADRQGPDAEHLGGALHAHGREVLAEAGVADLG